MRDLEYLFNQLAHSDFRRRFRLHERERDYLRRQGLPTILDHGTDFIAQRLAPAQPLKDGKQTPWRGHPVFIAQHATATCCRQCLSRWHGIAPGRALTAAEQRYILTVIETWLRRQEGPQFEVSAVASAMQVRSSQAASPGLISG